MVLKFPRSFYCDFFSQRLSSTEEAKAALAQTMSLEPAERAGLNQKHCGEARVCSSHEEEEEDGAQLSHCSAPALIEGQLWGWESKPQRCCLLQQPGAVLWKVPFSSILIKISLAAHSQPGWCRGLHRFPLCKHSPGASQHEHLCAGLGEKQSPPSWQVGKKLIFLSLLQMGEMGQSH